MDTATNALPAANATSLGSSPTASVRANRPQRQIHDADGVGQAIHDPGLGVGARHDGDGLEPDRDHGGEPQRPVGAHGEDLEPRVGRVDDEQPRAVRSQRDRMDLEDSKLT
jgi:hypothetical protein